MYDVIIIGSGLGGLVCGALLSRAGQRVLVLERQVQPGGCLQSYRRKGLSFDTGLHYVGGLAEGQRLHRIFSYLGLLQQSDPQAANRELWQRLDADGFDRVTIGDRTFNFAEGYQNFVDTLADSFPQERQALQQYVSMLQRIDSEPMDTEGMYRLFGSSAYDYLTEQFRDPLLINVLSGTSVKMELRRETLPLFTFAHGNSSYIGSSWRLRGSGNQLVDILVNNITSAGGSVVCKAEAEELIERNGRIETVRCKNGETYEGRTFVSDIHPALTFSLVKDSQLLRGLFRRRISQLENTMGIFTVSLVLKPDTLPYFNHNKYIYREPNVWTCFEQTNYVGGVMVSARVPDDGTKYVRQIDLLTQMPWSLCERWTDTQIGHRGADYEAMKAWVADECIALAEREIAGLAQMIEQRYTSSPLTWRDYTLTPEGSAYGVRKDCRNLVMTMLSPRTPIPNLLLTGQSLMLHGIEGVTMTALKTCEELFGQEYIKTILNNE